MPDMKVTIVGGAGGVGASTAFNLALLGGRHEIILVDSRPEMITSHVMDLEQVLELSPGCTIEGGNVADVRDADVVVLLSSTPLTVGTSRLEYLGKNAAIADQLADELTAGWDGMIVVVTNPVDPLVTRAAPANRSRPAPDPRLHAQRQPPAENGFRQGAGRPARKRRRVGPRRARRQERSAARPRQRERRPVHPTPDQATRALEYVRNWYVRHVALDSGRSSTWTSGLGVARMVSALHGDGELWPASVVLDGEYGIEGAAVTVPVTIGRGGAEQIHEWELAPGDLDALRDSAELVRAAAESIDSPASGDDL